MVQKDGTRVNAPPNRARPPFLTFRKVWSFCARFDTQNGGQELLRYGLLGSNYCFINANPHMSLSKSYASFKDFGGFRNLFGQWNADTIFCKNLLEDLIILVYSKAPTYTHIG